MNSDELKQMNDIPGDFSFDSGDQMIYEPKRNQLVSYIVGYDKPLYFNLESKTWSSLTHENQRLEFGHHSKVYIPEDSVIVTLGGYGYHQYKGVMMKYSFISHTWEEVDISKSISPRYLGSAGYLGNGKLLYFGGYGSESGKQEESPHNYYDLYEIDIHTNEIKKRWEKKLEPGEEHFTNSNSMIIDKERGAFYVLSYINKLYNTRIQIREFSLDSPKERLVGTTIPYTFSDVRSYCNLFLCPKLGKLLAVTTHTKETEGLSDINIYTIAYRPFAEEDILAQIESSGSDSVMIIAGILVLLLILGGTIYVIRRKKHNTVSLVKEDESKTKEDKRGQLPLDIDWNEDVSVETIPSSIILLGGFQVINKEGKDITRQFSPTVKSLFLLLLLSTLKNGKGITAAGLRDILWFDKDDSSARNNRNVNLSRLRPLLQTIGDIEIIDDSRYWSISIGKDVYCDYQVMLAISSKINSEPVFNKKLFGEFLRIVSHGLFLPNTHTEWLDSYKSEYSSALIEFLLKVSQRPEVQNDYELLIQIGDVILLYDTLDEDGIRLKCYGLYHSNKKGKALQCYNKFSEDYKNLLNEDYKEEFNNLVKK
ncbi:hypothetical protein [Bacteroides sp. 224]|uniref:hypothetical protein n=1 Tax=Bacteroides sp. 224 TaxID=2302936 RepID=UPI0013D88561|nr:hypothetical protein [Bacteroides sp. 224]